MYVTISYEAGEPIYEQIKTQLRGQILCGALSQGEMLPSIRMLAKELKIGVITAKRAYDDLCTEGFLYSVQGKGVFVANVDKTAASDFTINQLRERLTELKKFCETNSVDNKTFNKLLKEIFGE